MELLSLQTLSFFIFFTYLIALYLHKSPSGNGKPSSGSMKTYPLLGNLPDFIKNRHRFIDWTTEILAGEPTNTMKIRRPGNIQGVITANPANVEHMLKTNFENYPKGDRFQTLCEDFLGRGIFNSDGHLWKMQRKTASFEFNTKSLRHFVMDAVRNELQNRLLPLLAGASQCGETLDLMDVLERFAFDNVCMVAFNEDPACLAKDGSGFGSDFARAFETATNLSAGRFRYIVPFFWKIKRILNVGSERRLRESISTVHKFAVKIIRSRKEKINKDLDLDHSSASKDLLSRFIASHDNSEDFLRDIVVSFILAGRDTTSSNLAWFFWILSSRPDVEQKILDEIKTIRTNNRTSDKPFYFDELKEMHYLHAAISESLRLFPPVAIDTKKCVEDDILPDGTFVGKGWFISYNAYAMARMEQVWGPDCRSYVPERWLENGVFKPASPFKYPIFHAGLRMCLGKEMAYIQMKSVAAMVIERFEVEVLDREKCPEKVLALTMRMRGGLPVRVRERCVDKVSKRDFYT